MATQRLLFVGLVLVLAMQGQAVLADFQVNPALQFEKFLHQLRSPLLQSQEQGTYNVSSQCQAAIQRLFSFDPEALDVDSVRALDAFGKPHAGILEGNWAWLGHYDECMALEEFNYCLVELAINMTMLMPPTNQSTSSSSETSSLLNIINIRWGICPPANCSEEDLRAVIQDRLNNLKITDGNITKEVLSQNGIACKKKATAPYSAGVICTVILCFFIAALMIIGALYDECTKLLAKHPVIRPKEILLSKPWGLLNEPSDETDDVPLCDEAGTGTSANSEANTPKKQSLAVRLLLCFALNRNLAKLLDVKQGDTSISALNGIRVISMFWIILGHTVDYALESSNTDNVATMFTWVRSHWGFQAVANAVLGVDTFFFLSGFLLAYFTFGRFRELKTAQRWGLFYFHRYWRLTPLYAFIILISLFIPPFFGYGPIWSSETGQGACSIYWWTNLLYINNFWPENFSQQCMTYTWYLANDMQFFIISPLLMAPLFYYPIFGWLGLIATLLASFITTGLLIGLNGLDVNLLGTILSSGGASFQTLVYDKPYCRIAPYLVGIALGYIMHRTGKRKVQMSPIMALSGWLAATAIGMSVVYGLYPSYNAPPMPRAAAVVYGSVSHFVWALVLAWVVYACKYGYGGLINTFLSWNVWVPLGRLTFSAYLMHPIVMFVFYGNMATPWHFSVFLTAFYFTSFVTMSYFVAAVLSLAIEYPFANLEKIILPAPRKGKTVERSRGRIQEMYNPAETTASVPTTNSVDHERGIADASGARDGSDC